MEHKIITDLAYTYIGLVTTMTKHYVDEGVPLLFNSSIRAEGIDFSNPIYLDNEFAKDNKNRKHRTGDVITVHTGDIGTSAIIPDSLDGSLGFATIVTRIHDKNVLLPEYLCAYLNYGGGKEQLYKYARDIRNNLNLKDFNKLIVPVPDLYRQKEIVKNVNTLNKIVCQRKQELAFFDDLIKARFVELFGDPVQNPKGYRVESLQKLIEAGDITYHLDGNHGGDYPRSEEFVDSGVPYIGANCIANGEIDFSLAKFLTEERAGKLRKGIAQNEDVLFAHNATVGPTVVLHTSEPKVILSTSLTAYRCNQQRIMPEYLATYMKSDGFVRQYSSEMKQTTRNQVPITAQKKYLFLIPPMDEQKAFSDFVKQVDKSKVAVQKSLNETQKLFDSLMQEYFG